MLVEATLDFPEEEIDFLEKADARGRLARIAARVDARARPRAPGRAAARRHHVVLAGQPNVGKSSLLNALAGAELAIVTPIPGTTRDKVSETIQIEGVPVHVIDTAGLREGSGDEVERIGIARSWAEIERADAVVLLHDLTRRGEPGYEAGDAAIRDRLALAARGGAPVLDVFNKVGPRNAQRADELALSARTGARPRALRRTLLERRRLAGAARGRVHRARRATSKRCATREQLCARPRRCSMPRPRRSSCWPRSCAWRTTRSARSPARSRADDLLGEIFSRFCIGK